MISKIQLKRKDGSVIFEYEAEDNSVKKALEVYIKEERESNKGIIDLRFADLNNTDLTDADLTDADLRNANLSNADLSGADLSCIDLSDADLSGANLIYSNLIYSNLKDTKLSGANLSNAILNSVENIKYATCSFAGHGERGMQLLAIKINNETMLFCGCFKGNEAELRKYIEEGDEKHKKSRLMALEMVLKFIEV